MKKRDVKDVKWKDLMWHFIVVGTSAFGIALVEGGFTILIPFYTQDILKENATFSSTLFAMTSFGCFLFHPLSGIMVAHTSCECMIITASFIHFIALICLSTLSSNTTYYFWCILCFIIGITRSMTSVSIETYISSHISVHQRGRFMTYQVVICRVAGMFGAFSNGLLYIHYSIRTTLLLNSMITIVFGCIVFALFFVSVDWRNSCFRNINNKRNDNNNMQSLSIYKVCQNNFSILLKFSVLCFGQLYTRKSREFILTFQANTMNMSKKQITTINTYSYIPDIAVFIVPGFLMDKFGRKYSLIPSLLCLIIASMFISFTNNYFQLCLIAVLLGLGDGLANGSLNTIASDIAPLDYHGRAKFIGIFYMICSVPNILSPIIIGNLSSISLFYASMSSSFFALISLLWTIFVLPETSKYRLIHLSDEVPSEIDSSDEEDNVQLIETTEILSNK